jgi:hypothetical protein
VKILMMVVMGVMLELPTNGSIIIILPIKLVLHIKLLVMIMVLDVVQSLNVKIVSLKKDVGHNKTLKFTESANSEMLSEKVK